MKPVLIVQNIPAETAALIIEYLQAAKAPYEILKSYEGAPFPNTDEVRAVICLGNPISVNEYQQHEHLKRLYAFVAEVVREDVPYLGICFGGQLLAKVLGASVERNKVQEIGIYTVRLTEEGRPDPLYAGFEAAFPVVQWHQDTFKIPFGRKLLVEGNDCRNQSFRNRRQVAVQFHLEATESMVSDWCTTYPENVAAVGKSREAVLAEMRPVADTIRAMNSRFLDNFFALAEEDQATIHKSRTGSH